MVLQQLPAFFTVFFASLGPTLSFAGVNAAWFSPKQILGATISSAVLGLVCGIGLSFFPPVYVGAGAALLFGIMSERLLASFLPAITSRILALISLTILGAVCALFFGIWPLCILFALYLLFALWDLRKHWGDKKEPLFSAELFNTSATKDEADTSSLVFKDKPNIYVLFLESFQSAAALRQVYGEDDAGVTSFLEKHGFTVFSRSFSNACWTQLSMQTLLRMAHYDQLATGKPEAFRHLHANGYEIHLFDVYMYTFKTYAPWADWRNFDIPSWVLKLYDNFLPFFMQSKCLMSITGGRDPFTDKSDYKGVKNDFLERSHKSHQSPQCYIMRFGAHHVSNRYRWVGFEKEKPKYLKAYAQAAADLKDMISTILERDKNAFIVAMGDHGPHVFEDVWGENPDFNKSMLDNGIDPRLVCQDLAGVLLAIRTHDGKRMAQQITSPCNLFRLVFESLGAQGSLLRHIPNMAFHYDNRYGNRPIVLAREGQPLERWEFYSPAESIEERIHALETDPDNPQKILAVAQAMEQNGHIAQASDFLLSVYQKNSDANAFGLVLGRLLIRQGRLKELLDALAPSLEHSHDPELLKILLWAMSLSGAWKGARAILRAKGSRFGLDQEKQTEMEGFVAQLSARPADAAQAWEELTSLPYSNKRDVYEAQIRWARCHALCLDAECKDKEALALLDRLVDTTDWPNHQYNSPLWHSLGFSLRLGDWQKTEERFKKAFAIMTVPYPETIHVWHAGVLEQLGKIDEALDILLRLASRNSNKPWVVALAGLFLIRHRNSDAALRKFKKMGYEWLRHQEPIVGQVFDEPWYLQKYGSIIPSDMKPLQHFIHYGWLLGLDPSPWLNTVFYSLCQWDVFHGAYDPAWHYLTGNPYEMRDPSMHFSNAAYLARHQDVDWSKTNPLVHFLHCGGKWT